MSIEARLELLLKILSIPLEEGSKRWASREAYTVYKYWRKLELISEGEYEQVFSERKLRSNVIMITFFRSVDRHFPPKLYKNGVVADVGSGFGFITFWLILSGARMVHSIGDAERISFISDLYEKAVSRGLLPADRLTITPEFVKVGDLTLSKKISKGSVDLVLLNDTLEHITPRIFPWLVKASYNDLRPGGYFISRQQNTDSPATRKILKAVWEEGERNIFIEQRARIIRQKAPGIDEADLRALAERTRGMDSVDFELAIQKFLNNKVLPQLDRNAPPIDVETDVPHEGDTSIQRIVTEFEQNGFSYTKVYPELMTSRRSRPFQSLGFAFPKLFLGSHIFDRSTIFRIRK